MPLTDKQQHILANLDRVTAKPRKIAVPKPRPRYQLDGSECTEQIASLIVRRKVRRLPTGMLVRAPGEAISA